MPGHAVVVAGAGPAGASIARLMALRGRRVMLVDPGAASAQRLELLAPAACPALAALGMAHLLCDPAIARPCLGIRRRWGGTKTEIDDFLRHPGGAGFVIARAAFDAALRAAAAQAGVVPLAGRVRDVRPDRAAMAVTVATASGEQVVRAGLVIDATGRASAVARRLGVHKDRTGPLVAERRPADTLQSDHANWLTVAGGARSWSYRIAGPGGRCERWTVYSPRTRAPIGDGPRVDASSAVLACAAGERWIAIGDAAASFDPVTSQGLANALSTALVAAGAIVSPGGLDAAACDGYSDAVAAAFRYSEIGRRRVYDALAGRQS